MNKLHPKLNTGLIIEDRPTDYILGGNSPIIYEARNLMKDWRPFRSRPERQRYAKVDAMNCVSQYATNQWEEQANWMLANNLWPEDALKFFNENGYITDSKFEISERFTAKMSKTTQNGNTFQNVFDSLRKDGVIPEFKWAATLNPDIDSFNWAAYYAEIPEELKLLAKESLKYFSLLYERIDAGNAKNKIEIAKKALEHAPLGLAVATCSPWEVAQVNVCDAQPNHAVCNDAMGTGYSWYIFDSYEPFSKELLPGYEIYSIYKAVLYPVKRNIPIVSHETFIRDIVYGESGEEVIKLKKALDKLGWRTGDNSSVYDEGLANVVFRFQLANISHVFLEMLLSLKGRRVGPKTRLVINQALNK